MIHFANFGWSTERKVREVSGGIEIQAVVCHSGCNTCSGRIQQLLEGAASVGRSSEQRGSKVFVSTTGKETVGTVLKDIMGREVAVETQRQRKIREKMGMALCIAILVAVIAIWVWVLEFVLFLPLFSVIILAPIAAVISIFVAVMILAVGLSN